jgi:hypothetical protein
VPYHLGYTPKIPIIGLEPILTKKESDFKSDVSTNSTKQANKKKHKNILGIIGVEPITISLKGYCSTVEPYSRNS